VPTDNGSDSDPARGGRPRLVGRPVPLQPPPAGSGLPPIGEQVQVVARSGTSYGEVTVVGYDNRGGVHFDKPLKSGGAVTLVTIADPSPRGDATVVRCDGSGVYAAWPKGRQFVRKCGVECR
jgi:hypothetical protein